MKSLKSIAEPPTQKVDTSVTSKAPKRIKTSEPNLCIASNSGAYFFRQGKIEHKLGHFPNLKQAIEAKRIYEIKVNNHGALAFRLTMRDVYEDYLEFRRLCSEGKIPGRRQIAKGTLKEGQDVFRLYLLPFFGDEKLAKITPRVFEAYTKKSGRTDLSNIRKVLVHFLGWCEQQEYITGVPKFVIPHLVRRQRRVLTDNELKALLANAHGSLKLFISCYLLNGMRAGEIITLKWSDVDFERRVIRLQKQNVKTRKAREMPANQHVLALMQYRKATQAADKLKTEFVFPNRKNPKRHADKTGLKGSWNRCKERAGLGDLDITPHDLRATFQSRAHMMAGFTDSQLEKFSGSNADVQRSIYVHLNAENLRGLETAVQAEGLSELFKNEKALGADKGSSDKVRENKRSK